MFYLIFIYILFSFLALAALCQMILRIGALVGICPQTSQTARAAAITIATGFAAIGAGGVVLIGAMLPMLADTPLIGFLLALGFASLCLGLGFTHAVATLRAVVADRAKPADPPEIADPAPAAS